MRFTSFRFPGRECDGDRVDPEKPQVREPCPEEFREVRLHPGIAGGIRTCPLAPGPEPAGPYEEPSGVPKGFRCLREIPGSQAFTTFPGDFYTVYGFDDDLPAQDRFPVPAEVAGKIEMRA
jgi:hypothetical protein